MSGLSELYLSYFWYVGVFFFFFPVGQQLQEHFHLPGIWQKIPQEHIMEKHVVREKP